MRILVLDTIYEAALKFLEEALKNAKLHAKSDYEQIKNFFQSYRFGTCGTYEYYFQSINRGIVCEEVIVNSFELQSRWAQASESRINEIIWTISQKIALRQPLGLTLPLKNNQFYKVLLNKVMDFRPDLIIVKDIHYFSDNFLEFLKKHGILLVAFNSSPLESYERFRHYSLVVSSIPSHLKRAQEYGCQVLHLLPGFDERNASLVSDLRTIDCSFVGSVHSNTRNLLEDCVNSGIKVEIYVPKSQINLLGNRLKEHYRGEAWGVDSFVIYGKSKFVINRHGSVAGSLSLNMRIFEATGMGACLLTETSQNISNLFNVGQEIVTYDSTMDMVAKIKELKKMKTFESIGRSGQLRVLSEHSMRNRYEKLLCGLQKL